MHKGLSLTLKIGAALLLIPTFLLVGADYYSNVTREREKRKQRTQMSVGFVSVSSKADRQPQSLKPWLRNGKFDVSRYNKEHTIDSITLEVCNKHSKPLLSFSIEVSGFLNDRSTPHEIYDRPYASYDLGSSTLASDIIVLAGQCTPITWSGQIKSYDTYAVKSWQGRWLD